MAEQPADMGQWLEAARAGSKEALGEALEACRNYLLMVANRQLDPQLRVKGGASDLVQETFLEAQRDFGRFQGTSDAEVGQVVVPSLVDVADQLLPGQSAQVQIEVPVAGLGLPDSFGVHALTLELRVAEPVPGIVLAGAFSCAGMQMASFQAWFYGDRAESVARDREKWQQVLTQAFPSPQAAPPES